MFFRGLDLSKLRKFLVDNGGMVFPGEGGKLMTSNPQGHTTAVSRWLENGGSGGYSCLDGLF